MGINETKEQPKVLIKKKNDSGRPIIKPGLRIWRPDQLNVPLALAESKEDDESMKTAETKKVSSFADTLMSDISSPFPSVTKELPSESKDEVCVVPENFLNVEKQSESRVPTDSCQKLSHDEENISVDNSKQLCDVIDQPPNQMQYADQLFDETQHYQPAETLSKDRIIVDKNADEKMKVEFIEQPKIDNADDKNESIEENISVDNSKQLCDVIDQPPNQMQYTDQLFHETQHYQPAEMLSKDRIIVDKNAHEKMIDEFIEQPKTDNADDKNESIENMITFVDESNKELVCCNVPSVSALTSNSHETVGDCCTRKYSVEFLQSLRHRSLYQKSINVKKELVGKLIWMEKKNKKARNKSLPICKDSEGQLENESQQSISVHEKEVPSDHSIPVLRNDSIDEDTSHNLYKSAADIYKKLKPEKFIYTASRLQDVVDLIFNAAISDPDNSKWYAKMCHNMQHVTMIDKESGAIQTFGVLLINKCQLEFEHTEREEFDSIRKREEIEACNDSETGKELQLQFENSEREFQRRKINNCRFIGELCELRMLSAKITLRYIAKLLLLVNDLSLECLCKLLTACGENLESKLESASMKNELKSCFMMMQNLAENENHKVSSRVRSFLNEVIELRKNQWTPKHEASCSAILKYFKNSFQKTQLDIKKREKLYQTLTYFLKEITPEITDDTTFKLQDVINLVFYVVINDPNNSKLYAEMCHAMQEPNMFNEDSGKSQNFRTLLINKCQLEFERKWDKEFDIIKKREEIEGCNDPVTRKELQLQFENSERKFQRRAINNCRFIGELFNFEMITVRIVLRCIFTLLESTNDLSLECLCKLLSSAGKNLESKTQSRKKDFESYFVKMQAISDDKEFKVSPRIQTMLKEVIELRRRQWTPNHKAKEDRILKQFKDILKPAKLDFKIIEDLYHYLTHILDEVKPNRFHSLVEKFLNLPINDLAGLRSVVDLIFFVVTLINNPNDFWWCSEICRIMQYLAVFDEENHKISTFKSILVDRCMQEFEHLVCKELYVIKKQEEIDACTDLEIKLKLQLQFEQDKSLYHRRALNNCRFFGELFKAKLLTVKITLDWINKLLLPRSSDSLNCLSILLNAIGKDFETNLEKEEKQRLKSCLEFIQNILSDNKEISRNIQLELQNLIEPVILSFREDVSLSVLKSEEKEQYKYVSRTLDFLITSENVESFIKLLKYLPIDCLSKLQGVIDLVFIAVINDPERYKWYGQACRKLQNCGVYDDSKYRVLVFNYLLTEKCQQVLDTDEIEKLKIVQRQKDIKACTDTEAKKDLQLQLERSEKELRKNAIIYCRLIGELFKLTMITPKPMLRCVIKLLELEVDESLECLCDLLTISGKSLESKLMPDQKSKLNSYYEKIEDLSKNDKYTLSPRIRTMLHDVILLRKNSLVSREPIKQTDIQLAARDIDVINVPQSQYRDEPDNKNTVSIPSSRESSLPRQLQNIEIQPSSTPVLLLSADKLKRFARTIWEEYEAYNDLEDSVITCGERLHPEQISDAVREIITYVIENKPKSVVKCGTLLTEFIKRGIVTKKYFTDAVKYLLNMADNLMLDCPDMLISLTKISNVLLAEDCIQINELPSRVSCTRSCAENINQPVVNKNKDIETVAKEATSKELYKMFKDISKQWTPYEDFPEWFELKKHKLNSKELPVGIFKQINNSLTNDDHLKAEKCGQLFVHLNKNHYLRPIDIMKGIGYFINTVQNQQISNNLELILKPLFLKGVLKLDDLNTIFQSKPDRIYEIQQAVPHVSAQRVIQVSDSDPPSSKKQVPCLTSYFNPFSHVTDTAKQNNLLAGKVKSEENIAVVKSEAQQLFCDLVSKQTPRNFKLFKFKNEVSKIPFQTAQELEFAASYIIQLVMKSPNLYTFYSQFCCGMIMLTAEKMKFWMILMKTCHKYFHEVFFIENESPKNTDSSNEKPTPTIVCTEEESKKKKMIGFCRFFSLIVNRLNNDTANITVKRIMKKLFHLREVEFFCEMYFHLEWSEARFEKSLFELCIFELLSKNELDRSCQEMLLTVAEDYVNKIPYKSS